MTKIPLPTNDVYAETGANLMRVVLRVVYDANPTVSKSIIKARLLTNIARYLVDAPEEDSTQFLIKRVIAEAKWDKETFEADASKDI